MTKRTRTAGGSRSAFEHFFFRDAPPHFLALFRIVFGLFLLYHWGKYLPYVATLFSREGMVFPLDTGLGAFLPQIFVPPSVPVAYAILGTMLLALILFIIGWKTRLAAAIVLVCYVYYWHLFIHLLGGTYDRTFIFYLFILFCSGCDRTYSLRMYLEKGSWTAWVPVSVLPQRIIALQVTALYLGVCWQKFWLPAWQDGEIIRLSMMGNWSTPLAYRLARLNFSSAFYDVANQLIKFCQFFLPWLFWIRATRWLAIGLQAFFLLNVTAFLGMWWFLALIPASFAFWEPERIQAWVAPQKKQWWPLSLIRK